MSEQSPWMTKSEAAAYLRVSTRQMSRLKLPRTVIGRSPRYSRLQLDEVLERGLATMPARKKGALIGAPLSVYMTPADGEEIIAQQKALARRR